MPIIKARNNEKKLEEKQNKKNDNKKEKKLKININEIKVNFWVIAVILIIIFSFSLTAKTFQNDTYYTIKIGELIKNNGIDMKDHFSWHNDLSYTYPHWLYDFLTYLIYSVGGFKGVYIATCALSIILGLSIFFVNSKLTKSKTIPFIITMGAMFMLEDYIAARAQLVTFILFIWEIYFIEKFLQNKKWGYALGLIGIATLIANLHVATWPFFFVLFMPYIGEYLIASLSEMILYKKIEIFILKMRISRLNKDKHLTKNIKKIEELKVKLERIKIQVSKIKIKREKELKNPYKIIIEKKPNVKWLVLIMIVCILTGLLTPIGTTPYTYLYKTMQGNTTKNISEHLPMTLIDYTEIMCILVVFLSILIFTKTKIKLSDLFFLGGLCYLMFSSRRQLSMFVLINTIVLTRLIFDMLKRYTKKGKEDSELLFSNTIVAILLIIFVGLYSYGEIKSKKDDQFVNEKAYPVQACDYILENVDLTEAKFFNEYNYGSYMLFRGIPVFIDSRADLYAPEFSGNKDEDIFTDFIQTSSIGKFYEDTFEKYGITHVICTKKSKINFIITKTNDENYSKLYDDENFVVYKRCNI